MRKGLELKKREFDEKEVLSKSSFVSR